MGKEIKISNLDINIAQDNGNIIATHFDSIALKAHDFVMITGNNGSGKSTFYKALFGVREKDDGNKNWWDVTNGSVETDIIQGLEGRNLLTLTSVEQEFLRANICYIGQNDDFVDNLSAYSCLKFPSLIYVQYYVHDKKEAKEKIIQLNSMVDKYIDKYFRIMKLSIADLKNRKPSGLSGGQRKMVHILSLFLKAELINSNLILMDEPLNNLDSKNKKILNNVLVELRENNQELITIIITHCNIFFGINKELKIGKNVTLVDRNALPYDCLGAPNSDGMFSI